MLWLLLSNIFFFLVLSFPRLLFCPLLNLKALSIFGFRKPRPCWTCSRCQCCHFVGGQSVILSETSNTGSLFVVPLFDTSCRCSSSSSPADFGQTKMKSWENNFSLRSRCVGCVCRVCKLESCDWKEKCKVGVILKMSWFSDKFCLINLLVLLTHY